MPEDLYIAMTVTVTGHIYENPLGGVSIDVTDLEQILDERR